MSSENPILSIQYLRAIAAVCVIVAHASGILVYQAGVDVFFVISGFIMWTITKRPQTPSAFLMNRLVRIIPLYWISTVLMAWHQHAPIVAVLKSMFFIPYFGAGSQIWPVLVQGWTLNYEVFFYLLIAASLLLPRTARLAAIIGVIALLSATSLLLMPRGAALMTYTNTLLVEFCFGIIIAEMRLSSLLPSSLVGLALIGLASLLFGLPALDVLPGVDRFFVWGVPSACVVLGMLALENGGWILRSRYLLLVGDASYAIYLFQSFLLKSLFRISADFPVPLQVIFVVVCVSAAGLIISIWVEKPLIALLRSQRPLLPAYRFRSGG